MSLPRLYAHLRFRWFARLALFALSVGGMFFVWRAVESRPENPFIYKFSLHYHSAPDHLRLAHCNANALINEMLEQEFALPYGSYIFAAGLLTPSKAPVTIDGEAPGASIIDWGRPGSKDLGMTFYSTLLDNGASKVQSVHSFRITPANAYHLLHEDSSMLSDDLWQQRVSDPAFRASLEQEWQFLTDGIERFKAQFFRVYKPENTLYNYNELKALGHAALFNYIRSSIIKRTSESSLERNLAVLAEMKDSPEKKSLAQEVETSRELIANSNLVIPMFERDWAHSLCLVMPDSFNRLVWWRNVQWLSAILIGVLCALAGLVLAWQQDPLRIIGRVASTPHCSLQVLRQAIRQSYLNWQERKRIAAEQVRRDNDRRNQLRRNEERRRQKEEEWRASVSRKSEAVAHLPMPYKLEPAAKLVEVVESPKTEAKVVEVIPDANRRRERDLIMDDLESLARESASEPTLKLVLEKCRTIKHLRELLILLETAHEQKHGGPTAVKLVLEDLASKRVPSDHLHPSTELFRRVLQNEFAVGSTPNSRVLAEETV